MSTPSTKKHPFAGVFEDPPEVDFAFDDGEAPAAPSLPIRRAPSSYAILPATHESVLLGNRYLNRGDGLILSSSSGMGKSSMQGQMSGQWALGRDFHGIKPNGPLRSLVVQSEDSDGDIAEVWRSMAHVYKWTAEEWATIDKNVAIVSDRTHRGLPFINVIKQHIAEFKPDLVWINPLQAFIKGDVTKSEDIGEFLREQLNGLNDPAKFGFVIVHHTTKPPQEKKGTRPWNEVMYDMAGGAEIINWARAIISLRPAEEENTFKLVLAKRGRRAGVVKEVEQGAGTRWESVTQLGLKHRMGEFLPNTDIPVMHWDSCEIAPTSEETAKAKGGRKYKYEFEDYKMVIPGPDAKPLPLSELQRFCDAQLPISRQRLFDALKRWAGEGMIEIVNTPGENARYRRAL